MAKKKKKKSSKWFDFSAFSDGYDFGDVAKTVVKSAKKTSNTVKKETKKATKNIKEDTLNFLTSKANDISSSGRNKTVQNNVTNNIPRFSSTRDFEKPDFMTALDVTNEKNRIKNLLTGGNDKDSRSYFQKGSAFNDGYDAGDITKTILGTEKDFYSDIGTGIGKIGEGLVDTGAYLAGGVSKLFGGDDFAEKTKKFIARDLVDEYKVGEKIGNILNPVQMLYDEKKLGKSEDVSVLGDKSDSLVQSAGQLGGTVALQAVGVPWFVTTGVTGFGSGTQEAFQNDATYGEAGVYGGITAGTEIAFEKIGGIKFGGKALDTGMKQHLSKAISNKVAKNLVKFGMDAGAEGTEEVLTEITQNIGRGLTFEDDKTMQELLTSEEAMDQYIEAFVGGAVMGGGFNAGKLVQSQQTGRDYDTGLTDNEQKVVNKEVESRTAEKLKKAAVEKEVNKIIAEQEKTFGKLTTGEHKTLREQIQAKLDNGELDYTTAKLSKKERTEIEKQVEEDLKSGYIGIDAIESTLSEEKTSRINELREMLETAKEKDRPAIEAELRQMEAARAEEMKGLLGKDNFLQESYRQEVLKGETFSRKVTKEDSDITKELIESAKNSKMNNTRKMHDLFETTNKIANDTGTKYGFVNNEQLKQLGHNVEGKTINGLVRVNEDGTSKVLINVDSNKAINTIIGHETTHLLEGTAEHKKLKDIVKEYATTKGDYDSRLKEFQSLYQGVNADIENEITADLVGDYLFTDEQFINNLSTKEPNVFVKIYDYIKHVYKMATAGSTEARQLEQVKRNFDKAYKQISKGIAQETKTNSLSEADSNTKFSMSDSQNRSLTEKQQEYFKDSKVRDEEGNLKVMYHGTSSGGHTVFDPYGKSKYGLFGTGTYFTDDKSVAESYTEKGRGNNKQVYETYLNITNPIDMDAQGDYKAWSKALPDADFPQNGSNEDFYRAMEEYFEDQEYSKWEASEIAMEVVESMGYDGITHIGGGRFNKADETRHRVYIAFQPEQIKNTDNANPTTDADIRYSLTEDSNGKSLSENQQHYYRNVAPELRDESGRIKRYYHGTADDFTIFDVMKQGGKNGTAEGYGIYLTDTAEIAQPYANKGKLMEGYVNITKPATSFKKTIKKGDLAKLIKATCQTEAKAYVEDEEYDNIKDALKDTWVSNYVDTYSMPMSEVYREVASDIINSESHDMGIVQEVMTGQGIRDYASAYKFYDVLKDTLGIDGFVTEWETPDLPGKKSQVVLAFNSNQFKNIDNENPTDNPDARYSISEDDIAPVKHETGRALTEEDLPYIEQQRDEAFRNITDAQIPVEEEPVQPTYEEQVPVEVESPFEGRDIQEVGDRDIKAYMYENPEVKPYFQSEAAVMLTDLRNSVRGEKHYNDDLYYITGGEEGWWGTTRQTAPDIAELLDKHHYKYADIEKGLKAIIEDNGKENNAISKRIEFFLDERLREGYTSYDGLEIPPNEEYIDFLREKQIVEYDDIHYDEWLRSLAEVEDQALEADLASMEAFEKTEAEAKAKAEEEARVAAETEARLRAEAEAKAEATREASSEEDLVKKTRKDLRKELLIDKSDFFKEAMDNAKNRAMALLNNTDTIRVTELVFGREAGKKINEAIFQKEIDNEARSIYWQNKQREDIKALGIKPRSKMSAAVQKYAEKQYVNEFGDLVPYGEAELKQEFRSAKDRAKIERAARVIREKYDTYIDTANSVLTRLGFDPIPKRDDYMRHFQELNDAFSRFGIPFNAQNMQEHVLPTDINGLTEFWSPQKNFFANIQPRKGIRTNYDAITGIDGYIPGIANLIFHTEDIQRGRALEDMIRSRFGQEKADEVLENTPEEERAALLDKIQNNHLSNYAAWVHEWTNNVAGKKNKVDRSIESMFGRKAFSFLDTTRKQVGANMIGFNIASSMTNAISSVQAIAKTNKVAVVKGTAETFRNIVKKDDFISKNSFLTSRFGTDSLSKTPWEKMTDAAYIFMKGMDYVTANQIVRSKYHELISKGMSEKQAHAEAGKFAARIMGDRTKGANAQLYNSKLIGMITQFQLEVNNQVYSMFYDTYHESKEKAKGSAIKAAAGMTFTLGQLFAFTHLFGKGFEQMAGYNPTFDVVGIFQTLFGIGGDDEEEKPLSERMEAATMQLLKSLPYTSTFTGGRIPIGQAFPVKQFVTGKDEYNNDKSRVETLKETLPYYVLPGGYSQIKKTKQGLDMFSEDLPVSGSYTDSGNLRFPVEDTPKNRAQAAIFGQWANENARDYINNERLPLKEKQIQEYIDVDIPISEYWDYREGLKGKDTLEEKFDYVAGLDLPVSKQNILINNVVDRKEKVDLTDYNDYPSYFDYNFAMEYPERYPLAKAMGGAQVLWDVTGELWDIKADKDENGKSIRNSRKEKVIDYLNESDLDYGECIMLFKSEYPADDTYNDDIVEYLNQRDDISYEDMESILKYLGAEVDSDGYISW